MCDAEDLSDVEAVLRGELNRFEGIVSRWERPLVNLAWRYVRNQAIAEEMAQEAFVRCFRKLHLWRRSAKFSSWLFTVALNTYRSTLRKRRPMIRDEAALASLTVESDEEGLEEQERGEIVRRAVTYLPEIYRDAITVYYFQEKDLAATALLLGLPEGTVKARLHRGRKLLRERLERILG